MTTRYIPPTLTHAAYRAKMRGLHDVKECFKDLFQQEHCNAESAMQGIISEAIDVGMETFFEANFFTKVLKIFSYYNQEIEIIHFRFEGDDLPVSPKEIIDELSVGKSFKFKVKT